MPDLDEHFRAADLLDVDDVWPEIVERLERLEPDRPHAVRAPTLRRIGSPRVGTGWRKIVTIAAALVLAIAAVAVAVRAFRTSSAPRPAAPVGIAGAKGWIACGGHPFVAVDPASTPRSVHTVALTDDRDTEIPYAWSQDGSRLLVDRASRGGHYPLVLNEDGTEVRVEPLSGLLDASFSPTGTEVAFASGGSIYRVDVPQDSQLHTGKLIARGGQHPSLSPDGSRIAYMRLDWRGSATLWVMNADGTGRSLVSDSRRLGDFGPIIWSPDGTRLAVQSYSPSHTFGIFVVGIDGSGLAKVVNHATSPSWSPDGSHIAFTDMNGELKTVNPDGSDVRDLGVGCHGIAWNPLPEPDS